MYIQLFQVFYVSLTTDPRPVKGSGLFDTGLHRNNKKIKKISKSESESQKNINSQGENVKREQLLILFYGL